MHGATIKIKKKLYLQFPSENPLILYRFMGHKYWNHKSQRRVVSRDNYNRFKTDVLDLILIIYRPLFQDVEMLQVFILQ